MNANVNAIIGREVNRRRKRMGIEEKELAARCGVRVERLRQIESGLAEAIGGALFLRLARALDCEAEDLAAEYISAIAKEE